MANYKSKSNKAFNFQHHVHKHVNWKTSTPLTKAQVSSATSCSDKEDDDSDEDDDDDGDEKSEDDGDDDRYELNAIVNMLFIQKKSNFRHSGYCRAKAMWN